MGDADLKGEIRRVSGWGNPLTLAFPSLVLLLPCQELLRGVEKVLEDKRTTHWACLLPFPRR